MTSPAKSSPTVLVVDDESAIVDFIVYSLGTWGYQTVSGTSSDEALKALKASGKTPSIAIIDIAIGAESGLELANTLVKKIKNLSILFISGYVNDMVMVDSMPNGTKTGFLQKVFTMEQLEDALKELQK